MGMRGDTTPSYTHLERTGRFNFQLDYEASLLKSLVKPRITDDMWADGKLELYALGAPTSIQLIEEGVRHVQFKFHSILRTLHSSDVSHKYLESSLIW